MSDVARDTSTDLAQPRRWRIIGPGLVVAATGVGAGDLAATLAAGSNLGYALLWAAVLGCVVKIALAEATGRWHLSTGRTIFDGWQSLGSWTSVYFGIYIVVWGFVYGAAAMSSTALPLHAMFEDVPFKTWAVISGLLGMVLVLLGRYEVFEKLIAVLVGIMFVTVVTAAVLATPSLPDALEGLKPTVPDDGLLYTLGLIGGVGGTITMAAYGYWINAKGWKDASWLRVMRLDNSIAYVATGIFVVSMLIVGAELLHASGVALEGEGSLLEVGDVLEDEYGSGLRWLFLIGFWATSFTSILGVWNGVSLLFGDFATNVRARLGRGPAPASDERTSTTSPWFRGYVLWLTFPPMILLTLDQPVALIVAYGALGAMFMPFLAGTLLWLMNSSRVEAAHRNGWVSNVVLTIAGALFIVLCVNELRLLIEDYVL
jgi:Mn2+/Fe2+ NRAMP family transporter